MEIFQKIPIRIIIAGRSDSGKTTLLINFLMRNEFLCNKFKKITIFSPTAYFQDGLWCNIKKPDGDTIILHQHYDEDLLDDVINKDVNVQHLIIFDDCLGQLRQGAMYRNKLDQQFAHCRHNGISIIVNTQSIMALTPSIRQDTDVYIILEQYRDSEIDNIKNEFYHFNKKEFRQLIKYCTEQFSFLMIRKKPLAFYKNFTKLNISFNDINDKPKKETTEIPIHRFKTS